jgi:hypothetical protein
MLKTVRNPDAISFDFEAWVRNRLVINVRRIILNSVRVSDLFTRLQRCKTGKGETGVFAGSS